ncbi:hepatic sodium/bile acid cotransporter-like [Eucyclogobius newberryi]|uniref:hepatic sodium/bile acid cotransporter-like n=1 Tax=Eucyclogobius newberryi TaxID=166745 RepID=UPI003B5A4116
MKVERKEGEMHSPVISIVNLTGELYSELAKTYIEGNLTGNATIGVFKISYFLNQSINFLTILSLLVTMVSLGCTMEISKIKEHLLKPKGVTIALVAQFCIMPVTAFSLAKILQMDSVKAVTVLICGCCPGGTLSNIFSLALKGDMNLSIVMTTCSSIVALGMMPLLLFAFCQGFSGLENAVPYTGIMTTLAMTLIPCTSGILINYYKPKYAPVVTKAGLVVLILCSILVSVLSGMAVKGVMWMIFIPDVLAAAALMPLIGFALGYVMSAVSRLNAQCCRTISMETGCQNIQLCTAILKVAFPPEVIGPMFLFPLVYIMFQSAEALLLTLCYRCYQTVKTPAQSTGQGNVKQEVKQP